MSHQPNVSPDLVWEILRSNNSYLVKRKPGGNVQFSKDPLNLTNKHSRKYAGFVNDKVSLQNMAQRPHTHTRAVGVQPAKNGGITLTTKKTKHLNRPASNRNDVTWGANKSGPKVYKGIANLTAKHGYRADLREAAIARASAIRLSQQPKKDLPEKKLRGAKAGAAADKA